MARLDILRRGAIAVPISAVVFLTGSLRLDSVAQAAANNAVALSTFTASLI
jgi:hypothetical protein